MKNDDNILNKRINLMSKNLKTIRHMLDKTAEEFSLHTGVSRQTISYIENGRTKLSKPMYISILAMLDFWVLPLSKLRHDINNILELDDDNDTFIESWYDMCEERFGDIIRIGDGLNGL